LPALREFRKLSAHPVERASARRTRPDVEEIA
jgi:hypothetical protein